MSAAPEPQQMTSLIADADLCVKCAICLPHCPTYLLRRHEGDSPRGRIALIQGLASGLVEADAALEAHLDGCVSCRRCEDVCPARVPYSRLLDEGRALLARIKPRRTRMARWLGAWLASRTGRALLRLAWAIYRRLGVQAQLRRSGLLGRGTVARLESFVPERAPARIGSSSGERRATDGMGIGVFHGCATELFERDAIAATGILLSAAGYAVRPVPGQGCCGALHQHAGLTEQARALARRNAAAFGDLPIATLTSGCAATLRDDPSLRPRVREFSDWLLQPPARPLSFEPLPRPLRAALHLPCTAASTMKSQDSLRTLLARVPGLEIVDLDDGFGCCGAAGSHFITHPVQADGMLAPKLDSIARLAPEIVFSANVGCSLHLAAGLRRAAATEETALPRMPAVPVVHPATWLAQRLAR